ncbi:MAG: NifB/NifX family molybdenum-iron cluster-binding protein [Melioribacteraceae bacterium]|nr:NifB/NifX family molybdenum-iron cluster-binding protein [Melioribacteraceae bacterium]
MKIAVAVNSPSVNSEISDVFGRSDYFVLWDTQSISKEIIYNPFSKTFDEAGIQSAQLLIEIGADAVLIRKIGLNAQRIFDSAGTKIFLCPCEKPETVFKLFIDNKLEIYKSAEDNYKLNNQTEIE